MAFYFNKKTKKHKVIKNLRLLLSTNNFKI